jgi:hypothetical protein
MSQRRDEFKRLERDWYAKLKKKGFRDIESPNETLGDRPLIDWDAFRFGKMDPVVFKAIRDYYEQAWDLLFTYKFANKGHRKVWRLHALGVPERDIAAKTNYRKSMIHYLIDKIARINGLKK